MDVGEPLAVRFTVNLPPLPAAFVDANTVKPVFTAVAESSSLVVSAVAAERVADHAPVDEEVAEAVRFAGEASVVVGSPRTLTVAPTTAFPY